MRFIVSKNLVVQHNDENDRTVGRKKKKVYNLMSFDQLTNWLAVCWAMSFSAKMGTSGANRNTKWRFASNTKAVIQKLENIVSFYLTGGDFSYFTRENGCRYSKTICGWLIRKKVYAHFRFEVDRKRFSWGFQNVEFFTY